MGGVPQSGDLQAAVFCFEISLLSDVRAAEKLVDKCSWRGSNFFLVYNIVPFQVKISMLELCVYCPNF